MKTSSLQNSVARLLEVNAADIHGITYHLPNLLRHIGERYTYDEARDAIWTAARIKVTTKTLRNWRKAHGYSK